MKFILYRDDANEWRWRLRARNGRILADSGEGYKTRSACLKTLAAIRAGASDTEVSQKKESK